MLKVANLHVSYGGLHALVDVSFEVGAGQLVTIAGPNGAGKSTLFKAISGTAPIQSGQILYDGKDLLAMHPVQRARLGIAHVPEGWQVFKSLTIQENLEIGALARADRGREWKRDLRQLFDLFPSLHERRRQLAGTLSGGQQQMVAIARGLAAAPRLLLLDEPSMGLAPALIDAVFERIAMVHRSSDMAILLVEQRAAEALELCHHGYVLESGRVAAHGTKDQLLNDGRVKRAYLGM